MDEKKERGRRREGSRRGSGTALNRKGERIIYISPLSFAPSPPRSFPLPSPSLPFASDPSLDFAYFGRS